MRFTCNSTTLTTILFSLPRAQAVSPAHATLLGSPICDAPSISSSILEKNSALERVSVKFNVLSAHDALLLLRHSFTTIKLQYLLRTAPCYESSALQEYDTALRSILSKVCNTQLENIDSAWIQATLPVKIGGLGARHADNLAPSAFLTSVHATYDLVEAILPVQLRPNYPPTLSDALNTWSAGREPQPPTGNN